MRIDILTIFPEMFTGPLTESLIQKARNNNIVKINIIDIRSFTKDKHHTVDDKPFGGGPGMVLKLEPIFDAFKSVGISLGKKTKFWPAKKKPLVIYLSPQGKTLDQQTAVNLSKYKHLVLLCGHYEGVDERVLNWVNQEISIGDYVLTGGELPAMVLVDSVVRMLPGVVKEFDSIQRDSFYKGILDYPNYTRPEKFKNLSVPKILFSGHHAHIQKWRKEQSLINTIKKRPDLIKKAKLDIESKRLIKSISRSNKCR